MIRAGDAVSIVGSVRIGDGEAMAQVNLTINGRGYSVACGDGQEAHIEALAADLDRRIHALSEQLGSIGEARLLVMAALLVADELHDAKSGKSAPPDSAPPDSAPPDSAPAASSHSEAQAELESLRGALEEKAKSLQEEETRLNEMADKLDQHARKLEAIAARLVDA